MDVQENLLSKVKEHQAISEEKLHDLIGTIDRYEFLSTLWVLVRQKKIQIVMDPTDTYRIIRWPNVYH